MTSHDIRKAYLSYFATQKHAVIPSASLLPENDPTTLFTGSGMQPMITYLLGARHPLGNRIADSQKCFRAVDIDEVGDNRHTTFFEMLGNWSLGDYFKKEQITWMFDFLVNHLQLNPAQLFVTVFRGNDVIARDTEAAELWQQQFASVGLDAKVVENAEETGMADGRIFYYPESKNWWSRAGVPANMPVGEPGGPDTEMFWDFGVKLGLHEKSEWRNTPCHVNCDCGRFLEIGNNVFMEYIREKAGFEKLAQQNVDFGGGLERLAAAAANEPDVFKIDLFDNLRAVVEELSGKKYGADAAETRSFRIVLDHLRAATFLIADGALPDNRDQGYFTRRLIRRAIRFADKLGITHSFCARAAGAVIATYREAYPQLAEHENAIVEAFEKEESQFVKTLVRGEKELLDFLAAGHAVDGEKAFYFYETYGFPLELTEELLAEKGAPLADSEGFARARDRHSELSRTAAAGKFKGGLADHSAETTALHTACHLMLEALRRVLGEHVQQRGSNITAERLRFDFSHAEKMTAEQITEVEQIVNAAIAADYPVHAEEMSVDAAKALHATGIFEDKYAALPQIKVYFVGAADGYFSKEICGGPHVEHTGGMGHFKIQKEESSSAGVRRIKAVLEK